MMPTCVAYIRHLRKLPAKSDRREKLYAAQVELTETKLRERRHDLVAFDEAVAGYRNLVLGVTAMAWTMATSLARSLNALTNRDVRAMIDNHVRYFLNALAMMAQANSSGLSSIGEADVRTAEHFFGLATADADQTPGQWIPPRPKPNPHMGLDHPNSHTWIDWRIRCGLLAAPHKTDAELGEFLTISDPEATAYATKLSTITAEKVAEIRVAEAAKLRDVQRAIDRHNEGSLH